MNSQLKVVFTIGFRIGGCEIGLAILVE